MSRECDHCSDLAVEVMSLVDHEFTGTEVRALNQHMAGVVKAERERVLNEIEKAGMGQRTVPWLHNVLMKLWGYRE